MKRLLASFFCAFALLASLPAWAVDYYISDCSTGAHASCVAGNNANAGTSPASPKQNISGFSLQTVPAGTRFFFARGGSWPATTYGQIQNTNCSISAAGIPTTRECIVFDAYTPSWGGTAAPIIRGSGGVDTFQIGSIGSAAETGGYVFRNLKFDGMGTTWRLAHIINSSYVLFEDNEITDFDGFVDTPAIQIDCTLTLFTGCTRYLAFRRNWFHDMVNIGAILGVGSNQMLVEDNLIENVGHIPDPFAGHHCMYLGGHSKALTVRGNTFKNCTAEGSGITQGGNLTLHGDHDDALIENNTFISDSGFGAQSIAISVTAGYADSGQYTAGECFRRVVIRGNRIGTTQTAMDFNHLTDALIEGNLVQKVGGSGINWRSRDTAADCTDVNPTIRNNTFRIHSPVSSTAIATVGMSPTGQSIDNNVIRFTGTGSGTFTAFNTPAISSITSMTNNSVSSSATGGTFAWSNSFSTRAAAQAANTLWDTNGDTSDPSFSASFTTNPTSKAGFSCLVSVGSAARNSGNASRGSATSIDGRPWGGVMWKGACGPNN